MLTENSRENGASYSKKSKIRILRKTIPMTSYSILMVILEIFTLNNISKFENKRDLMDQHQRIPTYKSALSEIHKPYLLSFNLSSSQGLHSKASHGRSAIHFVDMCAVLSGKFALGCEWV